MTHTKKGQSLPALSFVIADVAASQSTHVDLKVCVAFHFNLSATCGADDCV